MAGEKTVDNVTFRIRHTMMLVSDLDRGIDFYTRLLGMDIQRIRPNPEKNERVGYLGYGTEDEYPSLELIETGGPGHVRAPLGGPLAALRPLAGRLQQRGPG